MCCATNLGPVEIGLPLRVPVIVTNSANEGVGSVPDTDINIGVIDPEGNVSLLTWSTDATWSETDSSNFLGYYVAEVVADVFDEPGIWTVMVSPVTPGTYYGIPCQFHVEVVNKQWPRFGPDFDRMFQRLEEFLSREGVTE